jgi:hypothetical protein
MEGAGSKVAVWFGFAATGEVGVEVERGLGCRGPQILTRHARSGDF